MVLIPSERRQFLYKVLIIDFRSLLIIIDLLVQFSFELKVLSLDGPVVLQPKLTQHDRTCDPLNRTIVNLQIFKVP